MTTTPYEPEDGEIARFQALQSGYYWRATQAIVEQGIDKDEVLLIQSIRWVDNEPHTIILRPHPLKFGKQGVTEIPQEDGSTKRKLLRYDEHRFLLNDFLATFEFEPEATRLRNDELSKLQGRVSELQGELLEAQRNPALLAGVVDANLQSKVDEEKSKAPESQAVHKPFDEADVGKIVSGTLTAALGTGITVEGVAQLRQAANREYEIATIKSKWIQDKTASIGETIKAMTPFYEEQAAAALAQTEDVRNFVNKLMRGIASLDLYVGKDVEVERIREGASAPKDTPLTFVQRKLLMDEELAIWADLDDKFDYSQEAAFFEALQQHDGLVNQIFPTQRCVLVMAVTRRHIDYGDNWVNHIRNKENEKVFLLVRDGMNLHRVFSPVESHLGTARLFPSRNDQEQIFRGFDGSHIKFEDVAFTDKLAQHELFALHYKRFLLLVCGLDHRLKLFGDFYEGPQSLDFVSIAFQDRYCRFLHDDDGAGLLPAEVRAPLSEWIKDKNGYLRSGSRVLCNWAELMNPETAPSACKDYENSSSSTRGFERRYETKVRTSVAIAHKVGGDLFVDIEVSGWSSKMDKRVFKCKVNLSKSKDGKWDYVDLPFLCLDAVNPADVRWYIHNRKTRGDHLSYIRFFKRAQIHILMERASELDTRERLAKALAEGNISSPDERPAIIDQTVVAWRAANRGKPLPHFDGETPPAPWKSLLDQMYMLAGEGTRRAEEVEAFMTTIGVAPLRLVLSGAAKLMIYAAPTPEERDDRLEPHVWVHRITLERGKTGYSEKSRVWAVLPRQAASETTLHQWNGGDEWAGRRSVFPSFERKLACLDLAERCVSALKIFAEPMNKAQHALQLAQWTLLRKEAMRLSSHVENPKLAIPFGVVHYTRTNEPRFLSIGCYAPYVLLYRLAPDETAREETLKAFVLAYEHKDKAAAIFHRELAKPSDWSLTLTTMSLADCKQAPYVHANVGVRTEQVDCRNHWNPLLGDWFANWRKDVASYARVWVADSALNANGDLVFDEILGIKLPEDYNPTRVVRITLMPNPGHEAPKYTKWIDICPSSGLEKKITPGMSRYRDDIDFLTAGASAESCGKQSSTHVVISPGEAEAFVLQSAKENEFRAIRSSEIADAPQPPEGVTRWILIPV